MASLGAVLLCYAQALIVNYDSDRSEFLLIDGDGFAHCFGVELKA